MAKFVKWSPTVFSEFCRGAILTPREFQVMYLHVHTDMTSIEIGDMLGYSEETVKADIRRCKEKYKDAAKDSNVLASAMYK